MMKKSIFFLFAAVLLFGMGGVANADSYTLTDTPSSDQTINGSSGLAITPGGTSTATAADTFSSATLSIIVDGTGYTASDFKAWFDSAQASFSEFGASASTVWYEGSSDHTQITYTTFPSNTDFGTDTWYANSLVMGIADESGDRPEFDTASLTVNYSVPSSSVPEPCTLLLLGAGMTGLGLLRSRMKKA
jgi:hypothetical protein